MTSRRVSPQQTAYAWLLLLLLAATLQAAEKLKAGDSRQASEILSQAREARNAARRMADLEYKRAVAKAFPTADRVEVFLLDFAMKAIEGGDADDEAESFPIRSDRKRAKILARRGVPPQEIPRWCAAVAETITSDKPGKGAKCHYPIHGIRISAGNVLLFETSFCWKCNNYYFNYDGDAKWEGLTDDAQAFTKLINEFMPIPEAERKRFEQRNAGN